MAKKILLADDSMTIQKVVELTFMDQDYEVTAVSDGSSAVAALEQMQPDIVIADVHMPGADGYAVCRHSKGKSPGTPVLLLVGTFEQFDEQQASQAGADDHLKKPFDSQELLQKVEEMVAGGAAPAPAAPETAPELTTQMAAPEPAPQAPEPAAPAPEPAAPAPEPVALSQDFTAPEPAEPVQAAPELAAPEPVAPPPAPFQDFTAPEPTTPEPAAPEFAAPAPEPVAPSQDFTSPEPAAPAPDSGAPEPIAAEPPPAQALETVAVSQSEPIAPDPGTPVQAAPVQAAPESAASELQPSTAETRPRRAEEPDEAPPTEPAESAEPAAASPSSNGDGDGSLSDEDVERIARRVVELASAEVLQAVAWEVIPDLAEVVIRERIQELEGQVD